MSINLRIKEVIDSLEKQGISKQELCDLTRISYSSLYDMMHEGNPVSDRNIRLLNLAVYVNEAYLYEGAGEMFDFRKKYADELYSELKELSPKYQKFALKIISEMHMLDNNDDDNLTS